MKPVVMKFGGTSVEDDAAINRTAKIVQGRLARGQYPVVVISAMAKVTDQLVAAAKAAGRGDRNGALAISSRLRNRHCDTSAALYCSRNTAGLNCRIGFRRNSSPSTRFCAGSPRSAN